ncbi:unnamed protein product [Rangifer tarandus platyrhynchus]|uniref:Uncharacterized protein n=2 Tax=Rangifer tarandus platyrhynchus TaxID=3082113 RepID=A0ACB0DYF1_RANTA|nr:unnamed protein product [Rangifer tarandus platyrhynchus]CAI9693290.1 unnamed protein product [Rangifer tarandus platyrhynchus]
MWSPPGWEPVPGANGAGYIQTPAADPARAGNARRRREGRPCEPPPPPPRARALAGWGWGWSRNSEAGARTGPERGGCVGAGAAEAAAPGGRFVYPGEEV